MDWREKTYVTPLPSLFPELIDVISRILRQGKVNSLGLKLGQPIRYTRFIREGAEDDSIGVLQHSVSDISLGEVSRRVPLTELGNLEGREGLITLAIEVAAHGLRLAKIGIGHDTQFWDLISVQRPSEQQALLKSGLLGAQLQQDSEIPEDVVLLFATQVMETDNAIVEKAFLGRILTKEVPT